MEKINKQIKMLGNSEIQKRVATEIKRNDYLLI